MGKTNTYTLFWLTGKTEIVKGNTHADAMRNAGYGAGAIRALDFYSEGDARKNMYGLKKNKHGNFLLKIK